MPGLLHNTAMRKLGQNRRMTTPNKWLCWSLVGILCIVSSLWSLSHRVRLVEDTRMETRDLVRQVPPQWTILLTVNDGFYDFFQNWWAHYEQLNMTNAVVVVAEDDDVHAKLKTNSNITVERPVLNITDAHKWRSEGYKAIVSTRAQHVLRHLIAGEDVLYTDVDTVWKSDPTVHLDLQTRDIVAQVDSSSYKGKSPYYCTGFMAIFSNAKTIQLMDRWNIELTRKPQLNQPLFHHLLHNQTSLRHVGLSDELFPSGQQYFVNMVSSNATQRVVVVHNNYIQGHDAKKKRFQDFGLWHQHR